MAKSVLTLDEINLLKNSEELKNKSLYGNLYEILQSLAVKKAISLGELSTLDSKAIATLTYNKKTMIDTVIKEWFAVRVSDQDPSQKVRCGLCNTPNKYIYYIRNRKNDILLNVGSHCITKFPGIEGYIEQKNQLKQMEKNQKITQRRLEFFERFSHPDKIIDNAEKYFSELPILLPYELYHNLQDTIKRMRLIFSQYVNEGKKPYQSSKDSFELFQTAIEYFNKLKKQANEYVSDNQYKKHICERPEIDWIISMKNFPLIDKISSNNGFYTKETISKVHSYLFLKNNYELLKERNHSLSFKFIKMNNNSFTLNYEKKGYSPYISFTLMFENISKEILPNCIFEADYFYWTVKSFYLI